MEAVLVTAKAKTVGRISLCSTFDFEHYKAIHRHLFCDLYEWAGVPRSINISKRVLSSAPQMRSHASALLFSGGWPSRISFKAFPSTIL